MSNTVEATRTVSRGRKVIEYKSMAGLKDFLSSLEVGVSPSVHVNGHQYTTALAVVDFGTPLEQVKLTAEQTDELNEKLRDLAKEIYDHRQGSVRINHDSQNGVYYANVA